MHIEGGRRGPDPEIPGGLKNIKSQGLEFKWIKTRHPKIRKKEFPDAESVNPEIMSF